MKKKPKNLVKHSSRVAALCLLLGAVVLAVAIYGLPASAEPPDPPAHGESILLTPGMAAKIALSDRDNIKERELGIAPEREVGPLSDSGRSMGRGLVESPSFQQGIYGQVTYNEAPISGVELRLILFDGSAWSTAATTATDSDGRYDFVGVPSLGPGQTYYVRYDNDGMGDSYLWAWYGPDITSYTAGSTVHGGDFDIANVSLLEPPHDVTRTLPVTFRWARRELPGDTYRLRISDPTIDFRWFSDDLGDSDSYTLESLASGMEYGHPYQWTVLVYRGADSFGLPYYYNRITFASGTPTPTPTPPPGAEGIYGQVTYNGAPISGVELELRFFDGSASSTAATTTTDSDGQYDFVGVPSLSPGQTYYVRYDNNGMGDSYLAAWFGPDITSYTAGSTVHGGDFDIANVSLLEPPPDVTRALPVTFRWARRELPGDTYRLRIFDPTIDFRWFSDDLGDTDSYTLESLVPGMEYGHPYRWIMWVYHGSDSFGLTYYYRLITFSESVEGSKVFLPLVLRSRP